MFSYSLKSLKETCAPEEDRCWQNLEYIFVKHY